MQIVNCRLLTDAMQVNTVVEWKVTKYLNKSEARV